MRNLSELPTQAHSDGMAAPLRPRGRDLSLLVVGGAILLGFGVIALLLIRSVSRESEPGPMESLIGAMPSGRRLIEPRLTADFAWAPPTSLVRSDETEPDLPRMRLLGAAGAVLETAAKNPSRHTRHAAAIAHLLAGDPHESANILETLLSEHGEPQLWSDLSAVHYQIAVQFDAPEHLKDALTAADSALGTSPQLPEALFNRALVIEKIGVQSAARNAWQKYLDTEGTTGWSDDARTRQGRLQAPADFRTELDRVYKRLSGGDLSSARKLVEEFPQESRLWGEVEILGRWAAAHSSGKTSDAVGHLTAARSLAHALVESSGEHLLSQAVKSIEGSDAARRAMLASAHAVYREGRITYSRKLPAEAEPLLSQSAGMFDEAGSPMALVARYYAANTVFDQNRLDEATQTLDRIRDGLDPSFIALRAQVEWQLALCQTAKAQWSAAFDLIESSHSGFVRLREVEHAAFTRLISAGAYQNIGETRTAFREQMDALPGLCGATTLRCQVALSEMTRVAMKEGDWRVASSLIALELESIDDAVDPVLHIDTLFRQAQIRVRQNDPGGARRSLEEATSVSARLHDPGLRQRYEADARFIEGVILAAEGSVDSLEPLTDALRFHRNQGRRTYVPRILLERARAHRRIGNEPAAWDDLRLAIEEIELQRDGAPKGEARSGFFDSETQLFAETIDWQLDHKDPAAAFHYLERARARILFDAVGSGGEVPSTSVIAGAIPSATTLLEFAFVEDRLVTFVVRRDGLRAIVQNVDVRELERQSEQLVAAAARSDAQELRETSIKMYEVLFRPIERMIATSEELVIVADSFLQKVPMGALHDRHTGTFLLEKHRIVSAPSAAIYVNLVQPAGSIGTSGHILAIGNPSAGDASLSLRSAEIEALSIAARYPSSTVLVNSEANREAFVREAADADVIHFAGHGVGSLVRRVAALRFAPGEGDDGVLYAAEIAKLALSRTRLVVLAACDTNRGEVRRMEGTQSTARAFLAAGVPTVIATLWKIDDDASKEFFTRLHEHLRGGARPSQALRTTQIEFMKRGASPAIWAAVQCIGR